MNYVPMNLRLLRQNAGKTQDQVAHDLFVTRQTISNYENGKSEPTIDMLNVLCTYYHVTLEDLVNLDLSKEKKSKLIVYDSVIFDKNDKEMIIINGTRGSYDYRDIVKVSILNEDAKYKGKTEPFKHTILQGVTTMSLLSEPSFFVGLKIEMKDGNILAIYVSKEKTTMNTDNYFKEREQAIHIKQLIQKIIDKYQEVDQIVQKKKIIDQLELNNQKLTKMQADKIGYYKALPIIVILICIVFYLIFN